jgi:hypothetical protein
MAVAADPDGQYLSESDREKVALLRQIRGHEENNENANYTFAIQFSFRVAIYAALMACIVWIPAFGKPLPPDIPNYMPLVIVLFFFTIMPLFGQTVKNSLVGVWGTFLACFHMWVMNGIYPGGMQPGMTPNYDNKIYLFGWINMLAFLWLMLWTKTSLGVKMFALSYDVGFMLNFMNPNSTVPFSENFTISSRGTAVNCMIATFIAVTAAMLANLVPFAQNLAFRTMKMKAMTVSHNSARLFLNAIDYYGGTGPSLALSTMQEQEKKLQAELASLAEAVDAAYYEGFDSGQKGVIRGRAEAHHRTMLDIVDRLRAVMIALETEGFESCHNDVMLVIRTPARTMAELVQALFEDSTHAMSDAQIEPETASKLRQQLQMVNAAVFDLSRAYDGVRRRQGAVISEDLLGESFFVLTLSAYARIVVEFADLVISAPAPRQQNSIVDVLMQNIKSTFDMDAMNHEYNMNFTLRYFFSILFAFCYCVYVADWNPTCVIVSSVLISFNVGTDILGMVNTLSAVILAGVLPPIVLNLTCRTSHYFGITGYLLPWVASVYWLGCLYPVYSKSQFALLGILAAALGAFSLVGLCANVDITKEVSADGAKIVHMAFAVIINALCEVVMTGLYKHKACALAVERLDFAFECMQQALVKFLQEEDISDALAPVGGALDAGINFNKNACIEPRFWRIDWKGEFYVTLVNLLRRLRLDFLMLQAGGASGSRESGSVLALVDRQPEWSNVKDDLYRTLADGRKLSRELLEHELGRFDGLKNLSSMTDVDLLEDLPALLRALANALQFPKATPATMEEDEICKISVVLVMLQSACCHMGQIIKTSVSTA